MEDFECYITRSSVTKRGSLLIDNGATFKLFNKKKQENEEKIRKILKTLPS